MNAACFMFIVEFCELELSGLDNCDTYNMACKTNEIKTSKKKFFGLGENTIKTSEMKNNSDEHLVCQAKRKSKIVHISKL